MKDPGEDENVWVKFSHENLKRNHSTLNLCENQWESNFDLKNELW